MDFRHGWIQGHKLCHWDVVFVLHFLTLFSLHWLFILWPPFPMRWQNSCLQLPINRSSRKRVSFPPCCQRKSWGCCFLVWLGYLYITQLLSWEGAWNILTAQAWLMCLPLELGWGQQLSDLRDWGLGRGGSLWEVFSVGPLKSALHPFPSCFVPQEADLHGGLQWASLAHSRTYPIEDVGRSEGWRRME